MEPAPPGVIDPWNGVRPPAGEISDRSLSATTRRSSSMRAPSAPADRSSSADRSWPSSTASAATPRPLSLCPDLTQRTRIGRSQSWSPRWADIEGDYGEKHVALCDGLMTLCSWGRKLRNLPVQVLKPNDHAVTDLKLACPVFALYDFVDTLSIATVGG
jgi:hypothetical protein